MKKRTDSTALTGVWGMRTEINPDDFPVELPVDGILEGGVDDLGLEGFDDFDGFGGEWGDFDFDDMFRGREKGFDPDDWMDWGDDQWDSHGLAGDPIGDLIGSAIGPYASGDERISGPWLPQTGGGGGSYKPFDFGIGGYPSGGLTSPRDPLAGLLNLPGGESGSSGVKVGGVTITGVRLGDDEDQQGEGKFVVIEGALGTSGGKKPADQKPDNSSGGGTKTNPSTQPTTTTGTPKTKGEKTPNPMDDRPVRGGPFAFTRNPVLDNLIRQGFRGPRSDPAGWGSNDGGTSGVGRGRIDWDLLVGGGVTDPVPYGDASGGGPHRKMRVGRVRPKKPTSDPSGWGG